MAKQERRSTPREFWQPGINPDDVSKVIERAIRQLEAPLTPSGTGPSSNGGVETPLFKG